MCLASSATRSRGSPGLHPPGEPPFSSRLGTAPPASPSAAQWGLMIHELHHAKTMACHCLARFATCTRRASLAPALLALLPLRRLAAATLRERPVPLRRDEVALHALHILRRLHRAAILPPARHSAAAQPSNSTAPKKSLHHRNNRLLDLRNEHTHSLFESALWYALPWNQLHNFDGLLHELWDRHVNDLCQAAIYGCIRKLQTEFQPKVLRKVSGRHGSMVKTTTSVRLRSPLLSFLINDNILDKFFSKWFDFRKGEGTPVLNKCQNIRVAKKLRTLRFYINSKTLRSQ